jgi:hypothetical protein
MGNIHIAPKGASVGSVGASVRIVLEIIMGGGREHPTIDIAFISLIESGSPCYF